MVDLENIEKGGLSLENGAGGRHFSDTEQDYLRELIPDEQSWEVLTDQERNDVLCEITQRYSELSLPEDFNLRESMEQVFDKNVVEYYERLEAPQDHLQIEAISDTLVNCEELRLENWNKLELSEQIDILQDLENKIAAIAHRPPCLVKVNKNMGRLDVGLNSVGGSMGGYSDWKQDITLNAELLISNNPIVHREMLGTLIHEGRHAYQDYNIHVCEVHPRHSEVTSWADTWGDGKWEYCGDTSSELGQRLYEQQSIEIDARNFAADVLDKFNDKLYT